MKKKLILFVVIVLSVGALASCSNQTSKVEEEKTVIEVLESEGSKFRKDKSYTYTKDPKLTIYFNNDGQLDHFSYTDTNNEDKIIITVSYGDLPEKITATQFRAEDNDARITKYENFAFHYDDLSLIYNEGEDKAAVDAMMHPSMKKIVKEFKEAVEKFETDYDVRL